MKLVLLLLLSLSSISFAKEEKIVLTKNNTAVLRGPVSSQSVADVMIQLSELDKTGNDKEPIYLVLQTPGGSVMDGLNLIQYMNSLRRPVNSVAIFAASMGFHILQSSNKRYVTKYGTIMSHRARGGFSGDIPQQVKSRFKHITDLLEKMDEQVISRTKGKFNKDSYSELIRDEYWAVGSNSVTDGFADNVANLKCDESLSGSNEKTFLTIFGPLNVTFSNCPLITEPLNITKDNAVVIRSLMNEVKELEF
jgi:ATP-dependent Clp protease protease subunit